MIQLRYDCLVFETASGNIPCSAEEVAVELVGNSADWLDPEILQNAAAGVLSYFRNDLGRESVTVGEFTQALARALRGLGLEVISDLPAAATSRAELDLRRLACDSGKGYELVFFAKLRAALHEQLRTAPGELHLTGLRSCVKQLTSSRRWCPRCRRLNDQIVAFLRRCLREHARTSDCSLVVC
jgi:hypothetical protein